LTRTKGYGDLMTDEVQVAVVPLDNGPDLLPTEEVKKAVVDINGRNVTLRQLTSTNIMQLQHEATILQHDHIDIERKKKSMDRVFRILRSAVAEDDREYVEDLMADGDLDMQRLVTLVLRLHKENEPTQPKVRRGRTPRSR
jgi:hypothetical protein